ncbi:hypothetical protein SDRG_07418 [Saprolegnia diclina VS20]|uniref:Coiled-coil domain-containing protein 12 n=1 Tax=Saprolegnia diclina (strain VS20) TaxID=1156394 RepID=T0QBB0_SAPDV|nr:hypothetical protein SDRG_07418 [Saprolegnia diclina VS20]EQC35189.1 hypothetical protein SDRG_07418 [Saprolegnia diclina VS20]|eukprot:XP_008611473.1 hypothetical protein SDRG_07418 [Saprolegnia diclina VS20]
MDNDRAKRLKAIREARARKENGGATTEEVVAVPVKQVEEVETPVADEPAAVADPEPEDEVVAIAPKKPTWDLERSLEKQMKKLERRTQNAIVQILREKMEREMQDDDDDEEGEEEDEA